MQFSLPPKGDVYITTLKYCDHGAKQSSVASNRLVICQEFGMERWMLLLRVMGLSDGKGLNYGHGYTRAQHGKFASEFLLLTHTPTHTNILAYRCNKNSV